MALQYLRNAVTVKVFDPDPMKMEGLPEAATLEEVLASDVILLSVPISVLAGVCQQIAPKIRPGQIVVDTCSVKAKPVQWMLDAFDDGVEIVGTHPLFGPDSGRDGIAGFKIAVCPIRVSDEVYATICSFLRSLELVVVEATPEEHDRQIALSQAIFHLIAQAMRRLGWGAQAISTPGPDAFYRLVRTVQRDTEQLFHDMERENPFAAECRQLFIKEILSLDEEIRSRRKEEEDGVQD